MNLNKGIERRAISYRKEPSFLLFSHHLVLSLYLTGNMIVSLLLSSTSSLLSKYLLLSHILLNNVFSRNRKLFSDFRYDGLSLFGPKHPSKGKRGGDIISESLHFNNHVYTPAHILLFCLQTTWLRGCWVFGFPCLVLLPYSTSESCLYLFSSKSPRPPLSFAMSTIKSVFSIWVFC
ncbi:hypothetical protein SUGI_0275520 [Cryptomeria japonica]|nr:hypothetical protein SUGI_0275520 [Cryptomeria japonica]